MKNKCKHLHREYIKNNSLIALKGAIKWCPNCGAINKMNKWKYPKTINRDKVIDNIIEKALTRDNDIKQAIEYIKMALDFLYEELE